MLFLSFEIYGCCIPYRIRTVPEIPQSSKSSRPRNIHPEATAADTELHDTRMRSKLRRKKRTKRKKRTHLWMMSHRGGPVQRLLVLLRLHRHMRSPPHHVGRQGGHVVRCFTTTTSRSRNLRWHGTWEVRGNDHLRRSLRHRRCGG